MPETKIADHGIERAIRERQVLHLRFDELDLGVKLPSQLDHSRREVYADRLRASGSCGGGNRARTAGDIQDPNARSNVRSLKKATCGKVRDWGEELGIAPG